MPVWPHPSTPAAQRARELHQELTSTAASGVASAPATWALAGEFTDTFGGIAAVGLSDLEAAAAVSPNSQGAINVRIFNGTDTEIAHTTTMEELAQCAAAQQPTTDSEGQPVYPPAPEGGIGQRLAGMVWMLVNRQVLSRETSGMDITVVNDIPTHAGLGAYAAMDVAVALALLSLTSEASEAAEAPLRARLADYCAQAVNLFSATPVLRTRHTVALRGESEGVSVVDYADNSVTQAPHPLGKDMCGFVLAVPGQFDESRSTESLRQRYKFISDASRAFGADNLRLLPDVAPRVIAWLTAVHDVHGSEGQPPVMEAGQWLNFLEQETERAASITRALRSRRGAELFDNLAVSQRDIQSLFGIDASQQLTELALARGASGARATSAGTSHAVVAYVPADRAENFAADLAADGLDVIALHPGQRAQLH